MRVIAACIDRLAAGWCWTAYAVCCVPCAECAFVRSVAARWMCRATGERWSGCELDRSRSICRTSQVDGGAAGSARYMGAWEDRGVTWRRMTEHEERRPWTTGHGIDHSTWAGRRYLRQAEGLERERERDEKNFSPPSASEPVAAKQRALQRLQEAARGCRAPPGVRMPEGSKAASTATCRVKRRVGCR